MPTGSCFFILSPKENQCVNGGALLYGGLIQLPEKLSLVTVITSRHDLTLHKITKQLPVGIVYTILPPTEIS